MASRRQPPRRRLKPLASLSKPALIALVKLVYVRKTLCTPNPGPYEELWEAGYAYRVGLGASCFVLNEDRRDEILAELHLAQGPGPRP